MSPLKRTLSRTNRRLKKATDDTRALPKHTPLPGGASDGAGMVYEINDVYLEIGQGGNSPLRGVATIPILMACFSLFYLFAYGPNIIWAGLSQLWEPTRIVWDAATDTTTMKIDWFLLLMVPFGIFGLLMMLALLVFTVGQFISVTDPVIRFDRKRQKVWMWTGRGPIEIDWNNLTPRVRVAMVNAYGGKIMTAHYAELGPDGEPLKTKRVEHVLRVGSMRAPLGNDVAGSLPYVTQDLEYVRRYMEEGRHAVPTPKKFLSHRVRWYAMFNFANLAHDWIEWREAKRENRRYAVPIGGTIFALILFPVLFPLQFTNWLALAMAPKPKWPKSLADMHEADLRELQEAASERRRNDLLADRAQESRDPRRNPVVRVNGVLVDRRLDSGE